MSVYNAAAVAGDGECGVLEVGAGQHRTPTLAWSRQWSCYNGGGCSSSRARVVVRISGEVNTRQNSENTTWQ